MEYNSHFFLRSFSVFIYNYPPISIITLYRPIVQCIICTDLVLNCKNYRFDSEMDGKLAIERSAIEDVYWHIVASIV